MESSMIPPRSLRNTDKVDVYGAKVESEDGVNHSRNCVAVAPRKLDDDDVFTFAQRGYRSIANAYLDCTICPTSKSPALCRTC
jgi:hypothetical protein